MSAVSRGTLGENGVRAVKGAAMWSELGITWPQLWLTVVSAVGVYVAILVLSRLFGQRQFTATSSYDLAFTFALGSLVGRTVLVRVSLLGALVALCTMFALHTCTTWLHHNSAAAHRLIQNRPVLLATDGRLLPDALRRTGTSEVEVFQALRLAGRGSFDHVAAVVLERNGRVSVIGASERIDAEVFTEVDGTGGDHAPRSG